MTDIRKVREDHATLARILGRLSDAIARETPPPSVELYDLRRELTSTLLAHLKLEDWVLYPTLAKHADGEVAALGKRFSDEMTGLSGIYTAYSEKWGATAIDADWSGYRADTAVVIEALTNRIIRENRELLPVAERIERAA
jgi:hypothetical protein